MSTVLMPQVWPTRLQCLAYYGNPYAKNFETTQLVQVPVPWNMTKAGTAITAIRVNKKCAESLARVLAAVWEACEQDQTKIAAEHCDKFTLDFAIKMTHDRSRLSLHSFGCALDWDDKDNAYGSKTHFFTNNSVLVAKFKAESWQWGGDWGGRHVNAMHFEAARLT